MNADHAERVRQVEGIAALMADLRLVIREAPDSGVTTDSDGVTW